MVVTADLHTRRAALIQEHVAAENRHDIAAALATFHTPRYDVPALGPAGQADGGEAVRTLFAGMFAGFPDWHAEPGRLHHADDAVFVEVRMTGTHSGEFAGISATGRRIDVPLACLFEFDDDRLLCEKVYFDFATVLQQLGAMPAPAATG